MRRSPTARGRPAFGWADSTLPVTSAIRSIASSIGPGPTEQLSPTTSAPHSSSRAAMVSTEVPYEVLPSSPTVIWAMTGSSGATARAASSAAWSSSRSLKVSRMNPSTPPSARPRSCRVKWATASLRAVGPQGSMRMPSGPIAPTTLARPLAAR